MNQTTSADQPIAREGEYTFVPPAPDEAAARRFLASVRERIDTRLRIALAVRDYEDRVANDRPYDDAMSAEEIRAHYGA